MFVLEQCMASIKGSLSLKGIFCQHAADSLRSSHSRENVSEHPPSHGEDAMIETDGDAGGNWGVLLGCKVIDLCVLLLISLIKIPNCKKIQRSDVEGSAGPEYSHKEQSRGEKNGPVAHSLLLHQIGKETSVRRGMNTSGAIALSWLTCIHSSANGEVKPVTDRLPGRVLSLFISAHSPCS